jgi:Holliday junction DNA helicase RuvA
MIDFLQGELAVKRTDSVTLHVGGVGFRVQIPLTTYDALPAEGRPASLLTHLHVREDELSLYGFATEVERDLFLMLLEVSRIGPQVALRVTGACPAATLKRYILDGDAQALASLVKGVGAKTARRLIVELQGPIAELAVPAAESPHEELVRDAVKVLVALGTDRARAERDVRAALDKLGPQADQQALVEAAINQP